MHQNIDNLFKDELSGLEGTPPEVKRDPASSWELISRELGAEENGRRRGAWWVAIAASIVAAVAVTWALSSQGAGKKEAQQLAMQQPPAPQQLPPVMPLQTTNADSSVVLLNSKGNVQYIEDGSIVSRSTMTGQTAGKPIQLRSTMGNSNGADIVANALAPQYTTLNDASTMDQSKLHTRSYADKVGGKGDKFVGSQFMWNFESGKTAHATSTLKRSSANKQQAAIQQEQKGRYQGYAATDLPPPPPIINGIGDLKSLEQQSDWIGTVADSISVFPIEHPNTESYAQITENEFLSTNNEPLSTFSIDVDRASYANHRRFLNSHQLPPANSVRMEEFVNYFDYDYPQPKSQHPFSITTEVSECPWNMENKLVHIGLQGEDIKTKNLPPSNLVFLLDVSGSMNSYDKLPLLKQSFELLVAQLREEDLVSIVVYAGAAGMVLPPTSGADKNKILEALNRLEAGGSTAGGAGIELAYATAKKNFKKNGNNRVILATDGDFNVGTSSESGLEGLIVKKREEGVFLTVLGLGTGNYQDAKMELLADKGNGNFAYIDNLREAQKVMVNEFGGTLFTIAKDVKLQIEFNPGKVQAYRLLGYENRALRNEDFDNDKIDAGELGAGHTVTALYEIVPAGGSGSSFYQNVLRYQKPNLTEAAASGELLTVKFRYKKPDADQSKLLSHQLLDANVPLMQSSDNFRWSAAVIEYGLLLRNSQFKASASFPQVLELAASAQGKDKEGYRAEFIELVKKARDLSQNGQPAVQR